MCQQLGGVQLFDGYAPSAISNQIHGGLRRVCRLLRM
jgi:hypothetical protein